jgi:hypothetical protein
VLPDSINEFAALGMAANPLTTTFWLKPQRFPLLVSFADAPLHNPPRQILPIMKKRNV